MNNNLKLDIEGFGLINNAKLEINKINIVGGVNASGKSTASKLLYCFLKANSPDIKNYALSAILPSINNFIKIIEHNDINLELPDIFSNNDDIKSILDGYNHAVTSYKESGKSWVIPDNILYEIKYKIDKFIPILEDKKNSKSYSTLVKLLFKNESLLDFKGKSTIYNDFFNCSVIYEPTDDPWDFEERFSDLDIKGFIKDLDDFDYNFIYKSNGSFNFKKSVFYIDSVSYFDLNFYFNNVTNRHKEFFGYRDHIEYILNMLDSYEKEENISEEIKDKIDHINKLISNITKGHVYKMSIDLDLDDDPDYYFVLNDSENEYNVISSGIQQISLIQILLDKYKLQPGSFLIIDEPEVNLHPEWQFKFAEILVLLAKELDINIYLNSHSPMFIEAMEVLTQYYDLEKDTNFYLTEKHDKNTYDFVKIEYDNLYQLYDNLARPFDAIEVYRLKNEYKKGNY